VSAVENVYKEFKDAAALLEQAGEVSLKVSVEGNLRRILLLSAASNFEHILSNEVEKFATEETKEHSLVMSMFKAKAITRQYHTWFDWTANNANQFFALFGNEFKQFMKRKVRCDDQLSRAITSFMDIGRDRNQLVHSDFASCYIEKTPDEIFEHYKSALYFVSSVGTFLREYEVQRRRLS
jgi:hypothetical protein